MKKYKHKIYLKTCPECKKITRCYRLNRLTKIYRKYPYLCCEEHTLWESKRINEKDFVKITFNLLIPDVEEYMQ